MVIENNMDDALVGCFIGSSSRIRPNNFCFGFFVCFGVFGVFFFAKKKKKNKQIKNRIAVSETKK